MPLGDRTMLATQFTRNMRSTWGTAPIGGIIGASS
jgi:hypothetical protein